MIFYLASSSYVGALDHRVFGAAMILATALSYNSILWNNFHVYLYANCNCRAGGNVSSLYVIPILNSSQTNEAILASESA